MPNEASLMDLTPTMWKPLQHRAQGAGARMRTFCRGMLCCWIGFAALPSGPSHAQVGEAGTLLVAHLEAGTLASGEAELATLAAARPADPEAQFALGAAQFLRAVEDLGQAFHRHGLEAPAGFGAPLFRMPVPVNATPEALSYAKLRTILQDFVQRMDGADATLARVGDADVKIVLDLAKVRLDLDGDGAASEAEKLLELLAAADPTGMQPGQNASGFTFAFDRADATWLRGYSQLLASFADFLLAHDFSAMFDGTFHVLFPRAGLPMGGESGAAGSRFTPNDVLFADAIALVHLIRWPVAEPERAARVRERLISVISLSRENWRKILAETDDDREWLPSPRQSTPFPSLEVTEAHVAGWMALLDTGEALLDGRVLAPHWRFSRGIDVKRVFTEPRDFDLVMWVTGPAALPYLADGPLLSDEAAAALAPFQSRLLRYVLWFN